MNLLNLFPGKKTYLLMIGLAVGVLAQLLQGEVTIGEAINQWLLAAGGMTLRKGIKSSGPVG